MYKRASRAMQHALRVDTPLPTGGYIGATCDDTDLIQTAANASLEECEAEIRQLGLEITRAQAELAIAKRNKAPKDVIRDMGLTIQVLVQRKSPFNRRHKALAHERSRSHQLEKIGEAVKLFCDAELQAKIFAFANGGAL